MTSKYDIVLVAYDFGRGHIDQLVDRLGDSIIEHTTADEPCGTDGTPRPCHRIRIDQNRMRGTHAHNLAFNAGFIPHLESP